MSGPLVSIVITTRNSAYTLKDLLVSIDCQTYKNKEIIVVDNNSSDQTKTIARKYTKNVYNKGPERSVQRNFGVSKSQGSYILILDSDMVLGKKAVEEGVKVFKQHTNIGALVIPEKSFGRGFWSKVKAFEREFYVGEDTIEAARFFRKTLFKKFGGYDPAITGPEDWDLPMRMRKSGVKIGRIDEYIMHNEGEFSPLRSAQKKFYYASHAWIYLKRHPESILTQGNLLLRPSFFRKWSKLVAHPFLASAMILLRMLEMFGAATGLVYGLLLRKR